MPPPPPPLLSTVPSFVATTSISRVLFRSSLVLAGLCLQYLASVSVSAFLLVETYLREKDRECYLKNCLFYKIERERERERPSVDSTRLLFLLSLITTF